MDKQKYSQRAKRVALLTVLVTMTLSGMLLLTLHKGHASHHEHDEKLAELDRLATQIYTNVSEGKMERALGGMLQLNEAVLQIRFHHVLTVEGAEALFAAINEAKHSLTPLALKKDEAVYAATKMRLAVDAVTHPKNPMWLQHYKLLKEEGQALQAAVERQDSDHMEAALQRLTDRYELIRPAIVINRDPSQVNQLDSYLNHLRKQPSDFKTAQFELILGELFERHSSTTYAELDMPQHISFLWSAVIGGIIISVLGYVAWRKYEYI